MRVIAGTARSVPLKTPQGEETRPITDKIKETLFNILQFRIPGAVFVDFFAGSGSVGIEALSRGARKCYFVETGKDAIKCIQDNLEKTKLADQGIVLRQDALGSASSIREERVDIIYMDPPYGHGFEKKLLANISTMKYLKEDTLIIVEAKIDEDFSYVEEYGFTCVREKLYKNNKHVFLSPAAGDK